MNSAQEATGLQGKKPAHEERTHTFKSRQAPPRSRIKNTAEPVIEKSASSQPKSPQGKKPVKVYQKKSGKTDVSLSQQIIQKKQSPEAKSPFTEEALPKASVASESLDRIRRCAEGFMHLKVQRKSTALSSILKDAQEVGRNEGRSAAGYIMTTIRSCGEDLSEQVMDLLSLMLNKKWISKAVFNQEGLKLLSSFEKNPEADIHRLCRVIRDLKRHEDKNAPLAEAPSFIRTVGIFLEHSLHFSTNQHRISTLLNCLESCSMLSPELPLQKPLFEIMATIKEEMRRSHPGCAMRLLTHCLRCKFTNPENEMILLRNARLWIEEALETAKSYEEPSNHPLLPSFLWEEIGDGDNSLDPLFTFPIIDLAVVLLGKKGSVNCPNPFEFVFESSTSSFMDKYIVRSSTLRSKLLMERMDKATRDQFFLHQLKLAEEKNAFVDAQILISIYKETTGRGDEMGLPETVVPSLIALAERATSQEGLSRNLLLSVNPVEGVLQAVKKDRKLLLSLLKTINKWPLQDEPDHEVLELIASIAREHSHEMEEEPSYHDLFLDIIKKLSFSQLARLGSIVFPEIENKSPLPQKITQGITALFFQSLSEGQEKEKTEKFISFLHRSGQLSEFLGKIPLDALSEVRTAEFLKEILLHLLYRDEPADSRCKILGIFSNRLKEMATEESVFLLHELASMAFLPRAFQSEPSSRTKNDAIYALTKMAADRLSHPEMTKEAIEAVGTKIVLTLSESVKKQEEEPDLQEVVLPALQLSLRIRSPDCSLKALEMAVWACEKGAPGDSIQRVLDRAASSWNTMQKEPLSRGAFLKSAVSLVPFSKKAGLNLLPFYKQMAESEGEDVQDADECLLSLYESLSEEGRRSAPLPARLFPLLIERAAIIAKTNPSESKNLLIHALEDKRLQETLEDNLPLLTILLETLSVFPCRKDKVVGMLLSDLSRKHSIFHEMGTSCNRLYLHILKNLSLETLFDMGFLLSRNIPSEDHNLLNAIKTVTETLFEALSHTSKEQDRGKFIHLLHLNGNLQAWILKVPVSWLAQINCGEAAEEVLIHLFTKSAPDIERERADMRRSFANALRQIVSISEKGMEIISSQGFVPEFLRHEQDLAEKVQCQIALIAKIVNLLGHHLVPKEQRKKYGRSAIAETAKLLSEFPDEGNFKKIRVNFEQDITPLINLAERLHDSLSLAFVFQIILNAYRLSMGPGWDSKKLLPYFERAMQNWKAISIDPEAREQWFAAIPALINCRGEAPKTHPLCKLCFDDGKPDALARGMSLLRREAIIFMRSRRDIPRDLKKDAPKFIETAANHLSEEVASLLISLLNEKDLWRIIGNHDLSMIQKSVLGKILQFYATAEIKDKSAAISHLAAMQRWILLADPVQCDLIRLASRFALSIFLETKDRDLFCKAQDIIMAMVAEPLRNPAAFRNPKAQASRGIELYRVYLSHIIQMIPTLEEADYMQDVLYTHLLSYFHEKTPAKEANTIIRIMLKAPLHQSEKSRDRQIASLCDAIRLALKFNLLEIGGISLAPDLRKLYSKCTDTGQEVIECIKAIVKSSTDSHFQDLRLYEALHNLFFDFTNEEEPVIVEMLRELPSNIRCFIGKELLVIGDEDLRKIMRISLAFHQPIVYETGSGEVREELEWLVRFYTGRKSSHFCLEALRTLTWAYNLYFDKDAASMLPLFEMLIKETKNYPIGTLSESKVGKDANGYFHIPTIMHRCRQLWEHAHTVKGRNSSQDLQLFSLLIEEGCKAAAKSAESTLHISVHAILLIKSAVSTQMFGENEERLLSAVTPLLDICLDCLELREPLQEDLDIRAGTAAYYVMKVVANSLKGKSAALSNWIDDRAYVAIQRHGGSLDFALKVSLLQNRVKQEEGIEF